MKKENQHLYHSRPFSDQDGWPLLSNPSKFQSISDERKRKQRPSSSFHPLINIWNWLPCFLWQHEKRSKCSNPPDLVSQYIIFTSLEEKRGVTTTTFSEQDFSFFKGISGLRVRDFWFRNFQTFLRSDLPLEEKYATNYSTTTKGLQVNPFSFPYVSQNAVWSHLTGPCSSRD